MPLILSIETSEKLCSVALADGLQILGSEASTEDKSHASSLTLLIDKLLHNCKISYEQLNAVAVGKGPGSYTGLRIGVSTAKGICYSLKIPLIAVDTFTILVNEFIISEFYSKNKKTFDSAESMICAMIDARRMEVYRRFFDSAFNATSDIEAEVINSTSYDNLLKEKRIYFLGSGADKLPNIIVSDNAFFVNNIRPHARSMCKAALAKFEANEVEDVAYFEPFYLKDFVATISKKKVF
ncbi:MAG TPA: tRNA (adenosine(37)-N6)-threonylcarbamoyltransferase complex dimerization subunit type 1 TsaB [Bacteroidales bacterium]|nr:tRNA (adenosine(37)-N6)-threonylcarbamoyltransferase complex dimerization subunit type 1 TsaB [Bacteroidales bacterium]